MNFFKSLLLICSLSFVSVFFSCSSEDEVSEVVIPVEEGFVFTGNSLVGVFALYVEELPQVNENGDVPVLDLSSGTDFIEFFPTAIYDHALFMQRTDGFAGFAKMVVDTLGQFREVGVIPLTDSPGLPSFRIGVRDSNVGVLQDRSRANIITVFDPETMVITAEIDMSAAPEPIDGVESRYQRFIFRGDEVFMPTRGNIEGETYEGFYLQIANLATNSYVGVTGYDDPNGGEIATVNNFGQGLVDTDGTLYIADGGVLAGSPANVYAIPAGSNEIDQSRIFSPVAQLAPDNILQPAMNSFKLVAPGKAIAKINKSVPPAVVDIVFGYPGETQEEQFANFIADEAAFNRVLGLLFTAQTASWCEIDLVSNEVTVIEGVTSVGIFSTGGIIFEHEGEIYFPVATTTEQAFYKYTPGIPEATKAFDITGGDLIGGFNLANNN